MVVVVAHIEMVAMGRVVIVVAKAVVVIIMTAVLVDQDMDVLTDVQV